MFSMKKLPVPPTLAKTKLWEIRALARALLSLARLISEASLPRYSDETGGGARGWGRIVPGTFGTASSLSSSQVKFKCDRASASFGAPAGARDREGAAQLAWLDHSPERVNEREPGFIIFQGSYSTSSCLKSRRPWSPISSHFQEVYCKWQCNTDPGADDGAIDRGPAQVLRNLAVPVEAAVLVGSGGDRRCRASSARGLRIPTHAPPAPPVFSSEIHRVLSETGKVKSDRPSMEKHFLCRVEQHGGCCGASGSDVYDLAVLVTRAGLVLQADMRGNTSWHFTWAAVASAALADASIPPQPTETGKSTKKGKSKAAKETAQGTRVTTGSWLSGTAPSVDVSSPIWDLMVNHVAMLTSSPGVILDLASGPGEPACSLAARFPSARVTASDSSPAMRDAAQERIKSRGLRSRVQVADLDMTDLSSVASSSVDVVTVCLGLYLVNDSLPAVLSGIARVLKPGGHCVATIWDDAPLVEACLKTMEDLTGRPWPPPTEQLTYGGGKMDPLWHGAGLSASSGHNTVIGLPLNLGAIRGSKAEMWWHKGPVAVLPRLAACPNAAEVEEMKNAFRERFRREGLVTSDGNLVLNQKCRLMSTFRS